MGNELYRFLAEYPLDKLLETIPTGLFLVDNNRKIAYWNAEAERITGYRADEAIGSDCTLLEGKSCNCSSRLFDAGGVRPQIAQICSFRHKRGHDVVVSKNLDLLRDSEGKIIGGIEAFVEVTQFAELESCLRDEVNERTRQLETEKEALRSVLDGMGEPAYICDKDFRIVYVNHPMRVLVGETRDERCYHVIYQRESVCDDCPMEDVLGGRIVRQEKKLQNGLRIYEVNHSPHLCHQGSQQKLAVFRDITERIEAERRLLLANSELDAFVATVSHDLRSPLTPLIGFADLLSERYGEQLDDIGKTCIGEIRKTGEKMKDLLEDLLALARVGQLKNPEVDIDATAVAEDVLLELADRVVEARARVEIERLPNIRLPEPLLTDLFRNLIGNAIKYAAKHNPLIEVSGFEFADRICYCVADHGPGICVDERETIFQPFTRGQNSSIASGSGIGLATVSKIARVYSGKVWVEETPGGGATFFVDLPRQSE